MSQAAEKIMAEDTPFSNQSLREQDEDVDIGNRNDIHRKPNQSELIASENIVARAVL